MLKNAENDAAEKTLRLFFLVVWKERTRGRSREHPRLVNGLSSNSSHSFLSFFLSFFLSLFILFSLVLSLFLFSHSYTLYASLSLFLFLYLALCLSVSLFVSLSLPYPSPSLPFSPSLSVHLSLPPLSPQVLRVAPGAGPAYRVSRGRHRHALLGPDLGGEPHRGHPGHPHQGHGADRRGHGPEPAQVVHAAPRHRGGERRHVLRETSGVSTRVGAVGESRGESSG